MTDNTEQIITDFAENADTAGILVATAQQAVLPRAVDPDGVYAVLGAEGAIELVEGPGYDSMVAERDAARPRRLQRSVRVTDAASLLDYIDDHTNDASAKHLVDGESVGTLEVWANLDDSTITAIIDGGEGYRHHTAILQLTKSREWLDWASVDGKLLGQEQFAEFVEDHLSTIAEPDGAKLLDICQTLTGRTNAQWRSQTVLQNGQRQLKWEEQIEAKAGAKGDLTIPDHLTLVLRPYQGGATVAVTARFRFRLRDGQLLIGVKLGEPDRILEDGFAGVIFEVQAGLPEGVTIRNGRP